MLNLLKKRTYPIGVDLGSGYLRLAQLGYDGDGLYLHAASCEMKPETVKAGSAEWQRWAAATIKDLVKQHGYKGKAVITALPSDDLFIDQIKFGKTPAKKIPDTVRQKVARKLPFPAEQSMIRHVIVREGPEMDVLVLAAHKVQIDRHLAIYEAAGLEMQSISVWPQTLVDSFTHFFSRRRDDDGKISMLMDLGSNHSNVVICQQENLLFARVIPIGFNQLTAGGEMMQRLVAEIDACCRYFDSVAGGAKIQLLMFLAAKGIDADICRQIAELAQRMQVPAQMGDVMTAVEKRAGSDKNIDRRDSRVNWATAFGLSLAGRD